MSMMIAQLTVLRKSLGGNSERRSQAEPGSLPDLRRSWDSGAAKDARVHKGEYQRGKS